MSEPKWREMMRAFLAAAFEIQVLFWLVATLLLLGMWLLVRWMPPPGAQ